jgi:hypothetical protein
MIKKLMLLLFFVSHFYAGVFAQKTHSISGIVKDAKNGETLTGTVIFSKEMPDRATSSNAYGFFSLSLPEGSYTIVTNYLGYQSQEQTILLDKDVKLNFSLAEKVTSLKTVEIEGELLDKNVKSTEIGVMKMDVKAIESVPVIFGEKDVMKTLQLLPGVQAVGDGNSGFYVRGGSVDQNLIILDEATVYNASHLLGFFSVFNSDALKNVTLYKGGIPAEYGGRLSSVVDVKMNEGNANRYAVKGGIGLISSRLTVEGPINKGKGSFLISGRRTYVDQFFRFQSNPVIKASTMYFYDLNFKANYTLGEKDRLFLSGYLGRDVFKLSDILAFDWGNTTATLRWNHTFSGKLFSNTSAIFSDYYFSLGRSFASNSVTTKASIRDYNLKQDFIYYANSKNTIKFGFNGVHHSFVPADISVNGAAAAYLGAIHIAKRYGVESAVYLSNEQSIGSRFQLTYGLRYSMFTGLGPGVIFGYDQDGKVTDTTTYANGQIIKNYFGPEPRMATRYTVTETSSLKVSYMRTRQYLHLLSNTTSGTPLDLWVPSSTIVKPQIGDQVSVGYFKNFKKNTFETSVEVYYKNMQNQIDYRPYANLNLNPTVESQLIFGRGFAYGAEFFIKKSAGKLNGWISYTLARSKRQFDAVNNGTIYSARQDRTHSASLVLMYDLSSKWSFGLTWVYSTGNAVTFPAGKYQFENSFIPSYSDRNGYRMPAYHRMDLSATYYRKRTEKFESSWNFSIYNVYGHRNVYQIAFETDPNDPSRTQAVRTALFTYVPSLTYNFKF